MAVGSIVAARVGVILSSRFPSATSPFATSLRVCLLSMTSLTLAAVGGVNFALSLVVLGLPLVVTSLIVTSPRLPRFVVRLPVALVLSSPILFARLLAYLAASTCDASGALAASSSSYHASLFSYSSLSELMTSLLTTSSWIDVVGVVLANADRAVGWLVAAEAASASAAWMTVAVAVAPIHVVAVAVAVLK